MILARESEFWLQQLCFLAVAGEMGELQCFNIRVYNIICLTMAPESCSSASLKLEQAPWAHFAFKDGCWWRWRKGEWEGALSTAIFILPYITYIRILSSAIVHFQQEARSWDLCLVLQLCILGALCTSSLDFPPVKTQPKALHTSKAFPWEESIHCYSKNNHKVLKADGRLLLPEKAAQMES